MIKIIIYTPLVLKKLLILCYNRSKETITAKAAADMDKAEAMQISGIALLLCFVTAALTFSALFVIYKEKFEPVFNMGRRLLDELSKIQS